MGGRAIPFGAPMLGADETQAVLDVLSGPILVHGPRAAGFETDFARFTGSPRAVSVSSCTAGLHLVWFSIGVGPGDEVIVPAQTHTATAHAVELTGAKPVFVDSEPSSGNIDIGAVEAAINERTRGVAVVHYLGEPVDMAALKAVTTRHDLFVLEDCALALGTSIDGVHAGLHGDAGCFSFYPVKHMTTAEGGMVVTRDEGLADRLTRQRAFGVDRTPAERSMPGIYDVSTLGFNYRMSEIHAALGIAQLRRVKEFLACRQANFTSLAGALAGAEGLTVVPASVGAAQSSYYCLVVLLEPPLVPYRHAIVDALRSRGVGTSVYYPRPVPLMSYYREKYGYLEGEFPVAERFSNTSIALPVGPHVGPDDVAFIASCLESVVAGVRR